MRCLARGPPELPPPVGHPGPALASAALAAAASSSSAVAVVQLA